ncbi:MAG: protein-L-isoaspartate O-methyltransferase [Methylophilaceae bacterium]|nr:protein-L-isoaspartate O-methyltransferase [Methylophilaceae bacterium]
MDIEQARFNMIEQQIRPWEVLDATVLDLLYKVPREDFVPPAYRGLAFADLEIPLGHGQTMWPPKLEARALQALSLKETDAVLEIGTGSGYMTALLASVAHHVYSVEIFQEFSHAAAHKLATHGISNVTLEVGDGARSWDAGSYDAIILTGSVPLHPLDFEAQLKPGGRLLAVVGEEPVMQAILTTCVTPGVYRRTSLFETCIPPLINAPQPEHFHF